MIQIIEGKDLALHPTMSLSILVDTCRMSNNELPGLVLLGGYSMVHKPVIVISVSSCFDHQGLDETKF